jgi:pyruvate/2-oxoglutarate dehydrogenase complex dihydrolipoamide dehydrogenase (E3) component
VLRWLFQNLGLEEAGVKVNKKGAIEVLFYISYY